MSSMAQPTGPSRERSDRAARRLRRVKARGRAGRRRRQPAPSHPADGLGLQPLRQQFRQDDAAARARSRDELRIVADQHGNPTSALDIADAIFTAASHLQLGESATGVYHLAGTGEATWVELATEILETSRSLGGPYAKALPIRTDEYPTKARRPANSRLDSSRFAADFGYRAPNWRESIRPVVERLVAGF